MPRPKKSSSPLADPLFAAMIAKLPSADKGWDVDRQLAWLNMMAMAFGTVYGGNAAERLACKCHDTQHGAPGQMPAPSPLPVAAAPAVQPPQKFHRNGAANGAEPVSEAKPIPHAFYIDTDGYARRKGGERIMPHDAQEIADMRGGETGGDLATVVWADGSLGAAQHDHLVVTLG
jgi:hypothetical protein